MIAQEVIWKPQPGPQTALVQCPIFEVFFGGARGGGKTEASIGDWLQHSNEYGQRANGVFFRREQQQLDEVIARTIQLFEPLGAKFNSQKSTWLMKNGARLKFRYLDQDKDAEAYQGHSYTRVYIEEATNFPSFAPIRKLLGTLRSATGVPVGMRLTGNPGGPGHAWVKHRYIDPAPQGGRVLEEEIEIPGFGTVTKQRVYIPSRIKDNALLMQNDPGYIGNLALSGNASLVRAWLLGDWNSPVGAYFTQFRRDRHVLPVRFKALIPKTALRFGSFDWGYATPFSFGKWVVSDGSWGLPRGALIRYEEWYGSNGKPNEGLRLDAPMVAEGIYQRIKNDPLQYIVCDPACFTRDGGPSKAETFAIHQVFMRRGDRERLNGWDKVRQHLEGHLGPSQTRPEGVHPPLMYIFEDCVAAINQLESVPADPKKPDDVDTTAEDHAVDDIRYAVQSRPWIIENLGPAKKAPNLSLDSLWKETESRLLVPERIA